MEKLKLRKKDKVLVIAGRDKGKTGEIIKIFPDDNRVLVAKVNIVTKHKKATQADPGGLSKIEAPIHYSNVMLVCPKCDKGVRPKVQEQGGQQVRVCRKCGEAIL
jgi:large subunit ribosomal protein L24